MRLPQYIHHPNSTIPQFHSFFKLFGCGAAWSGIGWCNRFCLKCYVCTLDGRFVVARIYVGAYVPRWGFFLSQVDGWIRSWGDGSNGLEEFCLNVFPRS